MRSLRTKITLLVLLLGVPLLIAAFQGFLTITEQSRLQDQKSVARRSLNRMAKELRGPDPRSYVADSYSQSGLEELGVGVTLINRGGEALWRSPKRAPDPDGRRGVQRLELQQGTLLYVMPERESDSRIQKSMLGFIALAIVIYGAGAWLLVGWTLRPIAQLVARVSEASSQADSVIESPTSDREITDLVATLNSLVNEVRTAGQEQVNSYATLSHELRTPIQSLIGHVELTLSNECSKEDLEATLLEVQRQVLRLNAVSEAVLMLQGLSKPSGTRVEEKLVLSELVRHALLPYEPLIALKALDFSVQVDSELAILASREHVEILLRNLVDNAVKHAPEGTRIEIEAREEGGEARVTILNQVAQQKVSAGNRLGLKICDAIAKVNGWSVKTGSEQGQYGATVIFPLGSSW